MNVFNKSRNSKWVTALFYVTIFFPMIAVHFLAKRMSNPPGTRGELPAVEIDDDGFDFYRPDCRNAGGCLGRGRFWGGSCQVGGG